MESRNYVYYQPNKKALKDNYGDCQIRCMSKVLNKSWLDTFDSLIPFMREEQVNGIFNGDLASRHRIMEKLGFKYSGVSNKRGSKRPTVKEFAGKHKEGTYVLMVANHVVACVDGKFYDTWDSGRCCLYGYYEKV